MITRTQTPDPDHPSISKEELSGRGARGGLPEQHLVRRILVGECGQPHRRKHRGRRGRNGGLQERQADVAESAAMLRRMVVLVFEGKSGDLRTNDCAQHQDNE